MEVIKFSNGKIIITSMDDGVGEHLNLSMKIGLGHKATGILGQTYLPKEQRKPNDDFKLV